MFKRAVLLAFTGLVLGGQADDAPAIRILIVTGYDHPAHDWRASTPALREALERDRRCKVSVSEDPDILETPEIRAYDALVLHFMNWKRPGPGKRARGNLKTYVEGGKGLILVHFACGLFADWPEFRNLAGRVWDRKNGHDPRGVFQVDVVGGDHPITRGLKSFRTDDELYNCLTGDRPVKLLASARSKMTGKDHPMAFAFDYGKGRVFHTTLGHDARALRNPDTSRLVRRGTVWAAGRKVADE